MNNISYKKKKSGYAELNLCPISQAILNKPHGSKMIPSGILTECEWKVYILKLHLFFFFFCLRSSFFLPFLEQTTKSWQVPSISFLGWQHSIVPMLLINFDCRDMFTYLFSWMDLIDCNRIIPLHNIKPSCNCRQDWLL